MSRQRNKIFRSNNCRLLHSDYILCGYSFKTPSCNFFRTFSLHKKLYYVRCRVVVVAKLKNWRVPSSDYQASLNSKFDSISLKLSLNFYFRSLFLIYSPNYELNFCRPLLSRKEALTMQHCMRDQYYLATVYLLLTKDLTSISLIY